MRFQPCGDAAATGSDRIHYLLWHSEMCGGVVLEEFWWLLQSGSSSPDRALSAYRICRQVFLQKRSVGVMGTGYVRNLCNPKFTKIALQQKDYFDVAWQLGTQVHSDATSDENSDAKAAVDKEWWKKLETIPAWNLDKVKSKKEVVLGAQRDESQLCHTDGHMSPPKCRVVTKNYSSTKAESCSEVIIVKDHLGAYAVFTEQSSSASQMIAAKVMDFVAILPGCDGQAADAVSASTQAKLEGAPRLLRIHQIRMF